MKFLLALIVFIYTANSFSQDIQTIHPTLGKKYDFGIEIQNDWKIRNQLYADIDSGKRKMNDFTAKEMKLFEKYGETFSSMWEIEGGGCSWYCGAGGYTIKTSSVLSANKVTNYAAENLKDLDYQTAWVEGKSGYGIGETIAFNFPANHPRITSVLIANGYIKSKKHWKENSRVKTLKMYVNNEPYTIIEFEDVYAEHVITLKKPLGNADRANLDQLTEKDNWTINFEILSVYKGDLYDDTVITEIYFDGLDVHCLVKGTQITMGDNSLKAIEKVQLGDAILSYNQETQETEISIVKELASPIHNNLIKIDLSNGTHITCTRDHPFLSSNTQWASNNPIKTEIDYEISDVAQLQIGSKIKTVDAIHEVVKITEIEAEQKTYTIVNLSKNNTFIANGILTGIEKLRKRKKCSKHSL
ncbi:hypothetical protein H0I23_03115 [Cellulophaga sp. HaHaR_3_176]|uniref:NADase-type glycan-binding domain-containing protein n=1 Tax=Cellulophaga sp. HaHaR_3_176 TaxID=1942464 RepID=UPI001C1F9968|nr:hypothetical protein [Cellulophaga sp. HaHaR_3_176]QWX84651.1 hypothetical protein H0I23_03115 [Cellulophaga sp. HaHaR_3_176]